MLLLWGVASVGGLMLVTEALRRRLAPTPSVLAGLAPVLAAAPLVFPFSVALMFGNLDAWFPLVYGLLLLAALGAGRSTRLAAGVGLGAAIVAKLHPASLLVWLAVRGRHQRAMWGVLAATVVAGLLLVLVSLAIGGAGPWADYLTVVRAEAGAIILTPVNVGPAPQLAMLLGASEGAARVLGVAVALAALALTAWAAERSRDAVTSLALAAVASLVMLPITWYHYPLALLPFAVAAYLRAAPDQAVAVRLLLSVAVLASLLAIVAPVAVWLAVALVVAAVLRTDPHARIPGTAPGGGRGGMKQRALLHGAGDTLSVPVPPSLTRVVAVTALGLSVLIGVAAIAGTIPDIARHLAVGQDWAVDGDRMFTASAAFGNGGDPYVFDGYLYSPLLTAVVWPLTRLGLVPAIVTWACLKAVVVAICVWDATRGWPIGRRVAAFGLVFTWLFVLADLYMGNTEILIAAAMYVVVAHRGPVPGTIMGLALATIAKPVLIPFLVWAWLFRRGEVMTAVAVAAVLSLVSAFVLGFQPYVAYATALLGAGRFAVPFAGNLGLTGVAPDLALPLGLLACCAYVLLLWRSHDESTALMWSLLVGLVAAPYVALYGAAQLLVGALPFVRAHPNRAWLLAIALPLSLISLMATTVATMIATLPGPSWPRRTGRDTSAARVGP